MNLRPTRCACARPVHRPRPLRYVTHHIQPQVCGGKSVAANEVTLCDDCHYTIHALLYRLKRSGGDMAVIRGVGTRLQRKYAVLGYQRCRAAGTENLIPDEGAASS